MQFRALNSDHVIRIMRWEWGHEYEDKQQAMVPRVYGCFARGGELGRLDDGRDGERNRGGSVPIDTSYGLAAHDSAQLRAEIFYYDTNNQVVDKGFQVWPASEGAAPPASPMTLSLGGGMKSVYFGYVTGLAENTEYYFRAYAETEDELFSYGGEMSVTTATYEVMNGQKWIVNVTPIDEVELENGAPPADVPWPDEVEVVFTDGTRKNVPVEWQSKEDYDFIMEDGGTWPFDGMLVLPDGGTDVVHPFITDLIIGFTVKVKQSNIVSVDALPDITVPVGSTLQQIIDKLPEEVGVMLANGKQESPSPEWDSGAPASVPDTPGTYTFTGTIGPGDPPLRNDDGLTASVTVHVVPYLWQLVGPAGFTDDEGDSVSFVLDNDGTPYVAFKDSASGGAVSVMKFDGSAWTYVGDAGLSGEAADSVSLAYDDVDDILYVAYADGNEGGAVTVQKFDPLTEQWSVVGAAGFSGGAASHISLTVDSWEHKLYVAYADAAEKGRVSVMSYDSTVWAAMGTPGFSDEAVRAVALTVDYGSLLLTYEDAAALYEGFAWAWGYYEPYWAAQSQPSVSNPSSYLVHHFGGGYKYAVYQDQDGVQLKEYYYGSWNAGSVETVTDVSVHALDLIVAKTGKYAYAPYVAYTDSTNEDKVTVKLLADGEWRAVGPTAFTVGAALELKLQVFDGTPYVVIKDGAQGGRLTVLKYGPGMLPVVQTLPAEDVGTTTATVGGNVTTDGIPPATERGAVYSTAPNPALGHDQLQSKADAAAGMGSYTFELTSLSPGTKYYVRAYAIHSDGTVYGDAVEFTTAAISSDPNVPPPAPRQTPTPTLKVTVRDAVSGATQPADTKITQLIGSSLDLAAVLLSPDGTPLAVPEFIVKGGDTFQLPNVPAGQYKLLLQVIAPTGEKLAGTIALLTVEADGSVSIDAELIDPYGIITDSVTGRTVDGVKVTLHWMDTELNRSQGRTPHELIILPILPDFPPNQNDDPQYSRDGGQYGWMVFPGGDYYILTEKEGYEPFDSRNDPHEATFGDDSYIRDGNIRVGRTIVEYSFEIDPKLQSTGEHQPYMKGYPDGSFKPDQPITREETVRIFNRLLGRTPERDGLTPHWPDVPVEHESFGDIMEASLTHRYALYETGIEVWLP